LPGFNTLRREGVELTGTFVATVNADLTVGALEETVTVTGEAATVDVQSAVRQNVMDRDVIDSIPSGRDPYALGVLVPGVSLGSGTHDVGGSDLNATQALAAHGGRSTDQQLTQSGMPMGSQAGGWSSRVNLTMAAVEEVTIDHAAVSAEFSSGGVRINIIPREGGNTFNSTLFTNFSNGALQGSNFSQELKNRGLSTPNELKGQWDFNPGVGGPIMRDKVWFYSTVRVARTENYVAGIFENRNANRPDLWTFDPDPSRRVFNRQVLNDANAHLTWQATPKNKFGGYWQLQNNCGCPGAVSATVAPEADLREDFPHQHRVVFDWTAPVTNRILLGGGFAQNYGISNRNPAPGLHPDMIAVTEQSTGLRYRAGDPGYRWQDNRGSNYRFTASYVTGTHEVRAGMNLNNGHYYSRNVDHQPVSYRFNNGVPNQLTMRAFPNAYRNEVDYNLGLFVQDNWTIKRLTLGLGLRHDRFSGSYPEQRLEPTIFLPTRNITFAAQDGVLLWNDTTPKFAASYDLFGTGRTALKVTLNKYLENVAGNYSLMADPNPMNNIVTSTTRNWNDANRNFVPDCNLLNPAANGECQAMANPNLGLPVPGTRFDPELMKGSNKRGFNWEFSTGVQHEILPRTRVDVSYFRRWFGNFQVTDDLTVGPVDFDPFSITAPVDPRLPNGGGYVVSGLLNLNPAKFGLPTTAFRTLASKYGEQTEQWNGVDVSVSARPWAGFLVQGGLSTGKTTTDNCEIRAALPEIGPTNPYCHVETLFLTQYKGFASYTVPRIDVIVSGAFQSSPRPQVLANYNAPNAIVVPSLGRNLSGGAANVTVNLVEPGTIYGERLNQLDLRFGKVFRQGRFRATLNLDIYNALNVDTIMTENNSFAVWRQPTSLILARFAKLGMQLDF
jgi:hypothetical protein